MMDLHYHLDKSIEEGNEASRKITLLLINPTIINTIVSDGWQIWGIYVNEDEAVITFYSSSFESDEQEEDSVIRIMERYHVAPTEIVEWLGPKEMNVKWQAHRAILVGKEPVKIGFYLKQDPSDKYIISKSTMTVPSVACIG